MTSITFTGNLAADPELRYTPSGRCVARFTVIENRRRRTEDGKGWEDAEPNAYRVQVWGSYAENIVESCSKGDRVLVDGSVVTDRWVDKDTREDRTAQHVKADEVGFSLRYHTLRATKATHSAGTPATEPEQPPRGLTRVKRGAGGEVAHPGTSAAPASREAPPSLNCTPTRPSIDQPDQGDSTNASTHHHPV